MDQTTEGTLTTPQQLALETAVEKRKSVRAFHLKTANNNFHL